MTEIENYYQTKEEPYKSTLLFLRQFILGIDKNITEEWKYKIPFFYFKKKPFLYFHIQKQTGQLYIGIPKGKDINHPSLIKGDRKVMKIYPVKPDEDINTKELVEIIDTVIKLY